MKNRLVNVYKLLLFFAFIFFIGYSFFAYSDEGREVVYQVNEEKYEGYFANAGKNTPLVLLIHDWDGLTDYEKKRANMLNKMGYSVFAVDLFGQSIRPTDIKDKRQHTGELYKDRSKMRAIMNGALQAAANQGADISNAVAMGYCFGGAAVLEFARSGVNLKGFATFHGGLSTPKGQDYSQTKAPIIVFHGSADSAITMDDFASLAKELETSGIEHEMITYSGALHAFSVFDSGRYHKQADKKSWDRFTEFLNTVLR